MRPDHYDAFAAAYAHANETGLFNAYYTRPAVLGLLGDVTGRRILDAGCGHGPIAADLRDRGAHVSGFDASPAMVQLAQERLGPDVPVQVVDLAGALPYGTGEFDDAVVALVLHYLEDWSGPLVELRRVLRPGGRLVLVVNHPVIRPVVYPDEDYFAVTPYTEDHTFDGQSVDLTFWHRPLHAMSDAFAEAGFTIKAISEPPYDPDAPAELVADLGGRRAFLCFLFFVLEAS